jgi:hypothetical protein
VFSEFLIICTDPLILFYLVVIVRIFRILNNMYRSTDTIFDNSSHGVVFNENKTVLTDIFLT